MKKILIVAMADSIHTARWLSQFRDEDIEFILFPSTPHRHIHPKIKEMMKHNHIMKLRIPRPMFRGALPIGLLDMLLGNAIRARILRRVALFERPEFIHAMEFQHGAYLVADAIRNIQRNSHFIATNWGSDIYWFQRFANHRSRIIEVLSICDSYSAECERDHELANQLGFRGQHLAVIPNSGGFTESQLNHAADFLVPSSRKVIVIKGYTGFVGRADVALKAIELVAENLHGYEMVVFSSDLKSRRIANQVARRTGLNITTYRRNELSHERMLALFGRSRIYIGISESDAISTSMLEALACGAFPIQTNTSCADEWIVDGTSGFIVDLNNRTSISFALRAALENDALVDAASRINFATVRRRVANSAISESVRDFYFI